MSVVDILFRVEAICKKYEKYDIDKQRELNAHGDDAFARLYASFETQIQSTFQVLALHKPYKLITHFNHINSFKQI